MNRIEWLERLTEAYRFKEVASEDGYTYILRESYEQEKVGKIEDKTAFEAVENHVHLLDRVKLKEYKKLEKEYAELIKNMLFEDMATPFNSFILNSVTMAEYGFALSEIVLKKRQGRN